MKGLENNQSFSMRLTKAWKAGEGLPSQPIEHSGQNEDDSELPELPLDRMSQGQITYLRVLSSDFFSYEETETKRFIVTERKMLSPL